MTNAVFLQRIPDDVYTEATKFLKQEYHFLNGIENGGRMRLANYFVGISSDLANEFIQFIEQIIALTQTDEFPKTVLPEGFESLVDNLNDSERSGGFSFGSFDMAVTEETLQNIEFQAIATYPFTAAKINSWLKERMDLKNAYVFANDKMATWDNFLSIYEEIMGGKDKMPVVITDRNLETQKTNFEFYATQKELNLPVEIVDIKAIYEKDKRLFYNKNNSEPQKVKRIYNRILPNEAIYDDHYPNENEWQLRYDKSYEDLTFVNHPQRLFEVSKRLLPYLSHPFNPSAMELENVVAEFLNGELPYADYVWKHKEGAAGFSLILSPTEAILNELVDKNTLSDYIVQRKIHYKIFKTNDGLEKIIELRFMTAHTENQVNIIPMARIGHCVKQADGSEVYKIHFGDNNKLGYGFAPALIFEN